MNDDDESWFILGGLHLRFPWTSGDGEDEEKR